MLDINFASSNTYFFYFFYLAIVGVLAIQDMLWSKLPYKKDKMLMAPLVSAAVVSYFISATETYRCKRKWMVTAEQMEDQGQTTFSPVNG